jgi:hypothetical protein
MADPLEGYDPNYYIEPTHAAWTNTEMKGPPDTDILPLPCCITEDGDGHVITASAWRVNKSQREMLEAGAVIRLTVWQHPIPPLAVGIEPPWCEKCAAHKIFDYDERKFVCEHGGTSSAEDDPDASRSAAPADLASDFKPAPADERVDVPPAAGGEAGRHPESNPDGGETYG